VKKITVAPFTILCGGLAWFFVVTIPMAKIQFKLLKLLYVRPHCLSFADHHSADIGTQRYSPIGNGVREISVNTGKSEVRVVFRVQVRVRVRVSVRLGFRFRARL
jgi:hypothetical protein